MFQLDINQIPPTADALAAAITDSLRRRMKLPAKPAVLLSGELPSLASLKVDVSNGQIDTNQPMPSPNVPGETEPGPTSDSFTVEGHPISIDGIPVHLQLSAGKVAFAYARNPTGGLIATLASVAGDGHLQLQMDHADLEYAILKVSQKVAGSSGVAIQKVSATLTSVNPTTVDVLLNITAKKFVTAMLRISGRLSVDANMVATASNLKADGDGMVGGIAANFIRPHLQQLGGRPLPLLAFSLGSVKLRGINVDTTDGVKIAAEFGSSTS